MIRLTVIALISVLISACATTPPDPLKKGARLMAQFRAASGGARLDRLSTYHSSGKRVRDGRINGVFDAWGDFRSMANTTVETFEGVTATGGYDGKVAWGLGPDGKARINSNPQSLPGARLGAYLNTWGYLFPDRFPATFEYLGRQTVNGAAYDVVKATPEGAVSVELWLDPKSHLLRRIVGGNGRATFVGEVQAYERIDGVQVMWRGLQTMTAGEQIHTESQHVEAFRLGPVPPERLRPPGQPLP